jgi:hypothetical protein
VAASVSEQETVKARCGDCDHVWVVAYLPLPLKDAARLAIAARCPHGHKGKVYVA